MCVCVCVCDVAFLPTGLPIRAGDHGSEPATAECPRVPADRAIGPW